MKETEKESRSFRRTLLIFIAVLGLFVLYAYAIDVTDINFEEPQDPQRQAVATRVVRALARPDFFVINQESRSMSVNMNIPCGTDRNESTFSLSDGRTVTISPNCVSTTQDVVIVTGSNFRANTSGIIRWHPPGDQSASRALVSFRTDGDGAFTAQYRLPDIRPSDEPQRIQLEESWPEGGFLNTGIVGLSDASLTTIDKIVETVLLALIATTVGTLLAIPISFLSARNLMEGVGLPLAAIMSGIICFVLGYGLGHYILTSLINLTEGLAKNSMVGIVVTAVMLVLIGVVIKAGAPLFTTEEVDKRTQNIKFVRLLAASALLLGVVAMSAHLGLVFADWLTPKLGSFSFLGRFIAFAAEGIVVLAPATVGFIFSLIFGSLGSTYGQEAILRSNDVVGRAITGITAMIGTALFIYGLGSFLHWLRQFDNPQMWTTYPAIIGGVLMLIVGLAVPARRQFPIGFIAYTVFRFILNIIRSIEPLIYVIVFAVWVGIGPFSGVMALIIHTIASLGKLFSEQVESIAEGPVEAITSTGASRLQTVVFAVVPQIIPPFIAFTLYRWDINVRFSTVLGFAGGGGIGFVLVQAINLLQYRQAAVMMIAIALVVWVLDYASSEIRNRLI